MNRVVVAVATLLGGLTLAAPRAHAFPTGDQFDMDPLEEDGAGGVAFTGAPRWAGHTCAVCHTGAPGRIGLILQADPVDLFDGGYAPGSVYRLRVVLTNQWAARSAAALGDDCGGDPGSYQRCDSNGYAIEIDDRSGRPVGQLAPMGNGGCNGGAAPGADTRVLADGSAATHSGIHHGQTAWDLCWTAPAAGTGPVTAFLAAVDGNGGDGTVDNPGDQTGDDVFAGAVPLLERGAPPPPGDQGGCSAGSAAPWAPLALVGLLGLRRRRRRAGRRAVALAVVAIVAASATGCATVKPYEKEYLSKRKMTFAPDASEDELDLHMQEAREGSSGGYGSAGGGCGCN
ncbi:MAG: DUF4266 domain-containing protein [Kofleriaceae bacterium]|nr:DUF4266 domain-containing protein [Kofleriaceae bacterium]